MKRWWILALVFLLTACASAPTYETVEDEILEPVALIRGEPVLSLPESAIDTGGDYWLWGDGEIVLEHYLAGNLAETVRQISGRDLETVTCMSRAGEGCTRYDLVWAAMSGDGEKICRAAILDDGSYHYVLTAVLPASEAAEQAQALDALFSSFGLAQY